ncbi:NTF2 fold immunity protein [Solimonas aquatica]|uniref:NTF2 fold immunity protein n=1 Tax=Solimonas aquatica TaxID=489703 RepID=A0A1H9L589_9GAMM|nr:NTF2 fold immunity protein [Solimonas aquatica]SER06661.1 NTF2 fold immunity protein [Solimonas aquatica]
MNQHTKKILMAALLSAGVSALPALAQSGSPAADEKAPALKHSSAAGDIEWRAWAQQYLQGVKPDEAVANAESRGAIGNGIDAIDAAREVWTAQYGAAAVAHQEPFRSYRKNNLWLVASRASKGELGKGLIAVLDRDSGRVLRVERGQQ